MVFALAGDSTMTRGLAIGAYRYGDGDPRCQGARCDCGGRSTEQIVERELDAAVLRTTFFGGVVGDGIGSHRARVR